MRFTLESHETANIITAVDAAGVRIGERHFRASLIVGLREVIPEWRAASMADISLETLEPALNLDPEILLLGTGPRTEFPEPSILAELSRRRIGFEAMDTAAACRTYNILAHEDRAVVAALLVGA